MSPPKQNLPPGSTWLKSSDVQPNPSRSERSRQRPQCGKDRRDVIVLHDATFQDVHDHHDAADPQDATRYGTDRRDVVDLNRAADLQHVDDLAANHADDLQHGHDLVVGHQEDDLRPADDLAAGLQDVIPTKITHLVVE
ncbi:unnamed protein product [Aphanomyces euteiches]